MPRIRMNCPNAGPVDLDVPGWGLFRNGETTVVDDDFFDRWLDEHTTVEPDGEVTVAELPFGLSIVDDDEEVS